jgi:predicted dehydrogenase
MTTPDSDAVRFGVVGSGHWAQTAHLPAIEANDRARLVAIAEPDDNNRRRAVERFAPEQAFAGHKEMLNEVELDAVAIAAPHFLHHDVAMDCLSAGLHILIEKPMTLTARDAESLVAKATDSGLEIVVSYPWNYNAQCVWVRDRIEDGDIGDPLFLNCFFGSTVIDLYRGRPWDHRAFSADGEFFGPQAETYSRPNVSGGGQGQTQLTHALALGLFLTGLTPDRVACFMADLDTEVDVMDALTLSFVGPALGTFGTTGAVAPAEHTDTLQYRIYGTNGHIHLDVSEGEATLFDADNPEGIPGPPLALEQRYPERAPLDSLVQLISGEGRNHSSGRLGATTVAVLEGAYRSAAADGAPIDVNG